MVEFWGVPKILYSFAHRFDDLYINIVYYAHPCIEFHCSHTIAIYKKYNGILCDAYESSIKKVILEKSSSL